jgi:penicillin amidase
MSGGPAAALYQVFYMKLIENTFRDDLGDELFSELLEFLALGFPGGIYAVIEDPSSNWWDDAQTPGVEDRNVIFRRSLAQAVAHLSEVHGTDPQGWDWPNLQGLLFEHPLGRERPLTWLFNRGPVPFGGSAYTLANAAVSLSSPFRVTAGTSFRFIADLNDLNATSAILPTGASGHPLSPHYFDQNEDWLAGGSHPLLFERSRVEAILEGKLTLTP